MMLFSGKDHHHNCDLDEEIRDRIQEDFRMSTYEYDCRYGNETDFQPIIEINET